MAESLLDQQIKILKNYEEIITKIYHKQRDQMGLRTDAPAEINRKFAILQSKIEENHTLSPELKQTQIDTLNEVKKQRLDMLRRDDANFRKITRRLQTFSFIIPHQIMYNIETINNEALESVKKIPIDRIPKENLASRIKSIEDERIQRLEKLDLTDVIAKIEAKIPIAMEEERVSAQRTAELVGVLSGGGGKYYGKYVKYKIKYMNLKKSI
ncbi:MAG: hypothetical protein Harvfovirus5_4 [Harvfovirus sp.]|uniref:Uncharacterized protein n=1 Tax=Harvfovirus sp. TaxID=2487768 RepID=A0A3G5A0P6_9VIRU|nr:MAG: hypothetical protein Harvfovirus5_4 [Harvfovirus sp.]